MTSRNAKLALWMLSATLAGLAASPAAEYEYHLTDLGPVGTDTGSTAWGIASVGGVVEVAGNSTPTNGPTVWTNGSGVSLLSSLPSARADWLGTSIAAATWWVRQA